MSNNTSSAKYPIIFVTGIGQTWSTLKGSKGERWNILPSSKEALLGDLKVNDYLSVLRLAAQLISTYVTGKNRIKSDNLKKVIASLFDCCIADENGRLPDKVDVRIYGSRSFDVLRKTDFNSGKICNTDDSLLKRLYRDIPCTEISSVYGEENMYCFNYSPFTNLEQDAELLHKMIEEVLEDQKSKTGADKVILIPMSMGATVVTSYLDKYYTDSGPIGTNYISKVISIVGAWDGSDGLADLLCMNTSHSFIDKLYSMVGTKGSKILSRFNSDTIMSILKTVVDSVVQSVLINTTSFSALIPSKRFETVSKEIFSEENLKKNHKLKSVFERAKNYNKAQLNLKRRMVNLHENHGVDFYFISGYNMGFGNAGGDFTFLQFTESSDSTNSDGVIQISSTAPGTAYVKAGDCFNDNEERTLSPEGSIDASKCWFSDTSWYFEGQEHELGTNNTALKLAGDIALGKVKNVYDERYPQFNKMRNIKGVYDALEKAERILISDRISSDDAEQIRNAVSKTREMLACTFNDPENDNKIIKELLCTVDKF